MCSSSGVLIGHLWWYCPPAPHRVAGENRVVCINCSEARELYNIIIGGDLFGRTTENFSSYYYYYKELLFRTSAIPWMFPRKTNVGSTSLGRVVSFIRYIICYYYYYMYLSIYILYYYGTLLLLSSSSLLLLYIILCPNGAAATTVVRHIRSRRHNMRILLYILIYNEREEFRESSKNRVLRVSS